MKSARWSDENGWQVEGDAPSENKRVGIGWVLLVVAALLLAYALVLA
jgi:hypothetical protein